MSRLTSLATLTVSFLIVSVCCQIGCRPQQPLFLRDTGRWQQHFIGDATRIEIPHVDVHSLPEVIHTAPPLTLDNPDPNAMWDLTLEEAIHMTLKNSTIIRTLSGVNYSPQGVVGVPSALLQSGGAVRSVYDPALIESDPRYGQEAALAAFDAQLEASAQWGRSGWFGERQARTDTGTFGVTISKYTAPGTRFYLSHESTIRNPWDNVEFPDYTYYDTGFRGGFTHPLLRGGGVEHNRIVGPGGAPGMYGGVSIARINTDISLNDFEMSTRNLVADVERAYWNLYYAYHRLESVRSGRDSAYQTWHQTKVHYDTETARGTAQNLAQSEQNYFEFRRQTELAQNNLFRAEAAMRYIMGLTTSDGRLIRPIDDPVTAPVGLDWQSVYREALFRSPELRRQKWTVKQRELELTASKNFLLPQLDLTGGYGVGAYGYEGLLGTRHSALSGLGDQRYEGWLGLTASMPLGFRQELAGVRNAQLNLAKARAVLREQELELQHQLGDSFRELSLSYQQMQTTLASYRAATAEVNAVQIAYEAGTTTLDLVLQAQRRQSEAETNYYSSVIDYNLAIMTLHYRKGSLLEYNNICLSEGEWPGKAYFDAQRRARERDAGKRLNYGFTLPQVVSRGTYQQHQHNYDSMTFETLPTSLPRENGHRENGAGENGLQDRGMMLAPPVPPVIESDSTMMIPMPVLPKWEGTTPVSFSVSDESVPVLTPARNMRYVR